MVAMALAVTTMATVPAAAVMPVASATTVEAEADGRTVISRCRHINHGGRLVVARLHRYCHASAEHRQCGNDQYQLDWFVHVQVLLVAYWTGSGAPLSRGIL